MTQPNQSRITITEHVRFNDDGSSDHIKVIDGELHEFTHFEKAPYVRMNPDIAWAIFEVFQDGYDSV